MSMKRGCKEPSVQKCLHCPKKDCDASWDARTDISEIKALVYAGMLKPNAVALHYRNKKVWKGKQFGKAVKECQT